MVLLVLVCHTTNINVWICAVVSDNYAVTVTSESYTLMGFLILQGKKYLAEQHLSYPQTYISSIFQWSSAFIWKCERKVDTWDNSPLFEDSLFVGNKIDLRNGLPPIIEKLFKNTESSHSSDCWNAILWPEACQIHRIHTEKPKWCIWQSTIDCLRDCETEEKP